MTFPNGARERQFDRALDRLALDLAPTENSPADPELAAARRLHRLYARQQALPDDAFIRRLEHRLLPNAAGQAVPAGAARSGMIALQPPHALPRETRRPLDSPRRWPAIVELAAVAALLVALAGVAFTRGGVLATFRRGNTAVAPPATGPEGMYRGDAARTGELPGPGPAGDPGLLWRFDYRDRISDTGSPPVVAGDTLYLTQFDPGVVTAIDLATGVERWRATAGLMSVMSPAVAGGVVYVVAANGYDDPEQSELIALDAATGAERWRARAGGINQTSPLIADGAVVLASYDGVLRAFDASTGAARWKLDLDTRDLAPRPGSTGEWASAGDSLFSPSSADGVIYAASNDGVVFAVDARTGARLWRFATAGNFLQTAAIADGLLVVAAQLMSRDPALRDRDGWVYGLDARTGAERWVWTGGLAVRPPAVADGRVFLAGPRDGGDFAITALDAATGEERWTFGDAGDGSAPVVAGDNLYVTSSDGGLYALAAATGATRWRVDLGTVWSSDPVVADGRIILAANGALIAIGGSETGAGAPVATPAADGDLSGMPPCTVQPRTAAEMTVEGTPSTALFAHRPEGQAENSSRKPILLGDIPEGRPATDAQIAGILQTLADVAACDRPGYERYLAALFTDDYFRRDPFDDLFVREFANGTAAWLVGAIAADGDPVTSLADVRVLPDGRAGVLKMYDYAPDVGEFTIFAERDGRWLIDETRQVAPQLNMPG